MSLRCADYQAAYEAARLMADATKHDVAIRRVKEFGRDGYSVGPACRNDSDYARAEIVPPGSPRCEVKR